MLKRALGIIMIASGLLTIFGGLAAAWLLGPSGPETVVRDWLLAFGILAGIAWFVAGLVVHAYALSVVDSGAVPGE